MLKLLMLIVAFTVSMPVWAQSVDDSLRNLSGKDFIFLGHKRDEVVKLSVKDLDKRKEGCVVAVTVLAASYSENRWQFDLRAFGTPTNDKGKGLPNPKACSDKRFDSKLVIAGDGSKDRETVLRSILNNVLLTPEIYLARHGKVIEYRETDETESARAIKTSKESRTELILAVEPFLNESILRARVAGSVELTVVVGTHGRIQSPQIVKSLDPELDAQALRAITLWRLEPARVDGRKVPARVQIEFQFRPR